jgi:hypothetical protein
MCDEVIHAQGMVFVSRGARPRSAKTTLPETRGHTAGLAQSAMARSLHRSLLARTIGPANRKQDRKEGKP